MLVGAVPDPSAVRLGFFVRGRRKLSGTGAPVGAGRVFHCGTMSSRDSSSGADPPLAGRFWWLARFGSLRLRPGQYVVFGRVSISIMPPKPISSSARTTSLDGIPR